MVKAYEQLKSELKEELKRILKYWCTNTLDQEFGGFVGRISYDNNVVPNAPKGIILNSRILWSFSAASNHLKTKEYLDICDRAYRYLKSNFNDGFHEGVFWELEYNGKPLNKRKQVYAQAFTIYALSEYYLFSKNEEAKNWAIQLFNQIEKVAKDHKKGGYLEAFNQDWSSIEDMRLSEKDMNAAKTMNTHLHVLEAYTTLLKIYDHEGLRNSLKELVMIFQEKFLNKNNHYDLFFDEEWKLLSNTISFGHDIETAWLVIEAAKMVEDDDLLNQTKKTALKVAQTFLDEALDDEGAVMNEKNLDTNVLDSDRHWWPQVEALIGLNYAYKMNNNQDFIDHSIKIWDFTKEFLIDRLDGEWHFRVDKNGKIYTQEDKVSMWKAPYHTTRACILLNS